MTKHNEHQTFKADEIPSQEISDPAVLSKTPLVSVPIVTYNHEHYIAQAIEGVLIQETDFPIELIIGEDCSTDRTREIVFDYQRKHPDMIRMITSDKNVGAPKNGLRIYKACRGKYLALCEGDDYWHHPLKLQMQVDCFAANPEVVLVAHRAYTVDVNNNIKNTFPPAQPTCLKPRDIIIKGGGFFATNSMMLKRSLFLDLPDWYYEFPVGDVAMINLAVQRGEIGFINDVMSAYCTGVQGSWSSRQNNTKKRIIHLLSVNKAYGRLMRQESRYTYWYYKKRFILYWSIGILYMSIVKRTLKHFLRR